MKKIFFIVAGLIMISVSTYLIINYLTTIEEIRMHMGKSGIDSHFEQGVYNGKVISCVLMLAGVGILLAGNRINNKKLPVKL